MKQLLEQNWPFVYLPPRGVSLLIQALNPRSAVSGDILIRTGEHRSKAVLILEGSVSLSILKGDKPRFYSKAQAGALLGEASVLLHSPCSIQVRCDTNVQYALIDREILEKLCAQFPSMAQSIANNLRERQGIFAALDRFIRKIDAAVVSGIIHLEHLLPHYKATQPALHPLVNDEELDFGAWSYAINRLPQDCTKTFVYLLSNGLPELLQHMDQKPVKTRSRRRQAWCVAPGKTLVALRDAKTDLADFVTCLSVHAVESQKLRRRFRSAELVKQLFEVDLLDTDARTQLIEALPLSASEWARFEQLWPQDSLIHLRQMIVHHEDYLLYIENELTAYDSNAAEQWIQGLRQALDDIRTDWREKEVHIISSNTYGVRRCLSSALHRRKQDILEWGEIHAAEIMKGDFKTESDRLYALIDPYLKQNPDMNRQIDLEDRANGIHPINLSNFTGISIDIIDTEKVAFHECDPLLPPHQQDALIINIDYAFGKQAEDIMGCLCLLLGQQIRSINVMGKAGALMGERGDILLARKLVMEREDDSYRLNATNVDANALSQSAGRNVHEGAVLTVYGTLLQNRPLLEYYRSFWQCVGLEMEGSFYARQIRRAQHHGVVPEDIAQRFIYYVSDLPLAEGSQLSKDMAIWEFIPPLYAITRHFLQAILRSP